MSRTLALFRPRQSQEKFTPDARRDTFLVTYPRSGTTWLSCVAAELLFEKSPDSMTEIGAFVPDIHDLPQESSVPPANQYLVKSHFSLSGALPYGEYRRVIYVLRDPRDVMLSYHRYARHLLNYQGELKAFAMDWVAGRIWPGSWQEHVNSWLAPRPRPAPFELTVLRYEDFVADPTGQVTVLASALGVSPGRERIEEIVADTSPARMREREQKGNSGITRAFKDVGPAKAGNWRELQSQEDRDAIAILEEYAGDAMRRVGYEPSRTRA